MALVVGMMAVIVAIARPKWPDSTGIAHSVVSGILVHGFYRSAATSVASPFYLVPAVTAMMAYVLFGERLDTVAIAGMVACAAAVFLVNRRA
jgi:drug/metabolite transporter (DMT)-like permease